ncbi:type II secretion system F family protein [Hazenella sp. IB182353]|uniref:type II secretion system F family protein n=1 Tax=Polycladospora coralii TaxID=2771432 RepID=UPI001746FD43|nr:type II secretion system F family protein [Polycladospora coralii]MBS7531751.1 type II secretion system F family protein [Polycladospora coralii]
MFLFYLLVIAIWGCLLFAAISYYAYTAANEEVKTNLNEFIPPWKVMKQKAKKTAILQKWMDQLAPTGRKIQVLSDSEEFEIVLTKAGYPYNLNVNRMHGAKLLGAIAGAIYGFFYYAIGLPLDIVFFIFSPMIGYVSPIYFVRFLAKRRQEQIRLDMPDFLDMMSITLQAGMSMDDALAYYVESSNGPLSEEFGRLNQEIKFGVQRETAYRSLMKRTDSLELEALLQSLIQAHNLGTPVAETFAQQADEMRKMRIEKAKEQAGKAAPKISLVSGLIIAPSIMLLILSSIIYGYFIAQDIFGGF